MLVSPGRLMAGVTDMAAYLVYVRANTRDAEGYEAYSRQVPPTYRDHPHRALVLNGAITMLEGEPLDGIVIVEFPSVEAARAQYFSDEYQAIRDRRTESADGAFFIVEGVASST